MLARPPASAPEHLLSRVRQQLQTIPDPDQRRRTTRGCQLLTALTLSQDVIQRLLARSILDDSSVYQSSVRKGLEEGRALGLHEGLQQGRLQEASALLLRQLERRCGPLQPNLRDTMNALPLAPLEALGDAVLDFKGPADQQRWLSQTPQI